MIASRVMAKPFILSANKVADALSNFKSLLSPKLAFAPVVA